MESRARRLRWCREEAAAACGAWQDRSGWTDRAALFARSACPSSIAVCVLSLLNFVVRTRSRCLLSGATVEAR